ncbi:hypothetical protein SUGI_1013070 [Cryptomeria japonica]|uniref:uncharacterized protein LOC131037670 n=1 Tax=Cryptomeria japonica TaxID=3369 RepID=UPI002414AE2F|nr:uncharacterized protein LOC131037670 [Cryptomeria japonica]GLJ47975.1 hypothetical protein SUGI_1013070 [Cryptomeria japonica]
MEEAQLRFGALNSADVKLWLTGPSDEKYERNPIYLHSAILKRSEFLEAMMSERWSSGKSTELSVTTIHSFDEYLKCLELMYCDHVYFSNVEECLAILTIASDLLANDLINKCMQYLQGVHWSAAQETQIGDVISCLGLKPLPDLAARLEKEDANHLIYVERIIKHMVSHLQVRKDVRMEKIAEEYIGGMLEGNTPRDVVELCRREILLGFKSSIHSQDLSAISSLSKFIEGFDGDILKAACIALVEDVEFAVYVKGLLVSERYLLSVRKCLRVLDTIIWFMNAIGDGKIIISRASRNSFLTIWLPIMRDLCLERVEMRGMVDKAVLNVVKGLPLADKIRICVEWIELYTKYDIDITTPLTLFKDLQDAHYKSPST